MKQRALARWEVKKGSEAINEGKEEEAVREVRLSNSKGKKLLALEKNLENFFLGGVKYFSKSSS